MLEENNMRRNKLITLGLLLVSSIAITAPLLTSCSTTIEETVVPPVVDEYKDCMFKGLNGKIYSFHKVYDSELSANNEPQLRFKFKEPMPNGGIVTYYKVVDVSKETYNYYNNVWKCNDLH